MEKLKALYDQDFVRWTEEQAAALRRAKSLPPAGTRTLPRRSRAWGGRTGASCARRLPGSCGTLLKLEASPVAEPRASWQSTIREARSEIEGVLEDSPSLRREAEAMISKQIRAAAELADDDLGQHDGHADAIWRRLEARHYTTEQVLGDWFPEEPS
jgi:hypothetical protein